MLSLFANKTLIMPKSHKRSYMRPMKATQQSILFDYVSAYASYICKPEEVTECVQNMIVPPVEEQLRILQGLVDVQSRVNTQNLDGVFMKLIMIRDDATIGQLMMALDIFESCLKVINAIIRSSYDIPIDVTELDV